MGIEQYLEEQGVTVPGGFGWKPCKCPYHSDRTASASVNVSRGRFHCFVCDVNEDLIGLIRRDTGAGYVEAQQKATDRYGQSLPEVRGGDDGGMSLIPRRQRDRSGRRGTVPVGSGAGWRSGL